MFQRRCEHCQKCFQYKQRFQYHNFLYRIPKQFVSKCTYKVGKFRSLEFPCCLNEINQDNFQIDQTNLIGDEASQSEDQAYLNVRQQVQQILSKEFNKKEFLKQLKNENIKDCVQGIGDLADIAFSAARFEGLSRDGELNRAKNQSKSSKIIGPKKIRVWVEDTFKQFFMEQLYDYHIEILVGCIKSGDRDLGYQYVSYLSDDRKIYAMLMKCWAKHGGLEALEEAVEVRTAAGYPPDKQSFGLLISTAGQERNIPKVKRILQYASQIGKRNLYVLNSAIDAYSKIGDFCSAIHIFIELLTKSNTIKQINQQIFYDKLILLCPESERYLLENRDFSDDLGIAQQNKYQSGEKSSGRFIKPKNANLNRNKAEKYEYNDGDINLVNVIQDAGGVSYFKNSQHGQLTQNLKYDTYYFPDAVTFTNMLKCVKNQEQLFWMYELMVELCSKFPIIKPNQKTFSVLFSQGSRVGVQDLNWILERCNDMNEKFKLQINSFVLSALVSCILQIRALKAITLKKLFNLLQKQYDEQDAVVIAQMLRLCAHGSMADKIQKVWATAKKNQQQQNPHILANLFTAIAANIEDAPFLSKIVQNGQKELYQLLNNFRAQIQSQKQDLVFDEVKTDQNYKSGGYGYLSSQQKQQTNFKRKKFELEEKDQFPAENYFAIGKDFELQSYAEVRKKMKLDAAAIINAQKQNNITVNKSQQLKKKKITQAEKKSSEKLSPNLSDKVTSQYKNDTINLGENVQKRGQILQKVMQPQVSGYETSTQSQPVGLKSQNTNAIVSDSQDSAEAKVVSSPIQKEVVPKRIQDVDLGVVDLYNVNKLYPRLNAGCSLGREQNSLRIVCNALIAVYSKLGDYQAANQVMSLMQKCYVRPSLISRNAQLTACARSGDFVLACSLLDCMLAQNEYDAHSFSIVLSACAKSEEPDRTEALFQLMKEMKNLKIGAHHYTALIDAHVRSRSEDGIKNAFKTFYDMKDNGIAPTPTTYGCILRACERLGDVSKAFSLYLEASESGVLPSDECHNMLINVCTKANRLEEALELIKALVRGKGHMQIHTINSLTRALCENYPDRAVRMLRLMHSKKIETQRETYLALVSACSNFGKAQIALDLYVEMRQSGFLSDCGPMSRLVCGLCRAENLSGLGLVFEDQIRLAEGETEFPISITLAGSSDGEDEAEEYESYEIAYTQKLVGQDQNDLPWTYKWLQKDGQIDVSQQISRLVLHICQMHLQEDNNTDVVQNRATVPDMEGMAAMLIVLAKNNLLEACRLSYLLSKQLYPRDFALCTINNRRMFESLISMSCGMNDLAFGLDVFDDWKSACVDVSLNRKMGTFIGNAAQPPKLSNATLAYLEACCRSRSEFEWRVYDVCAAMRQQRESFKQAQLTFPTKSSHHFKDLLPPDIAPQTRD